MNNRVMQYFEPPVADAGSFWRVVTEWGWVYVDEDTARRVLAQIERPFGRRWIRFCDLFGDRVGLRVRDVVSVDESTPEARELGRRFQELLRNELPDDRPWEDC